MISRRQLVQYDDLDQSEQNHGASSSAPASQPLRPSKKRKRSHQKNPRSRNTAHWDDTGDLQIDYEDGDGDVQAEDGEIGGESRELTHEEMWDDSALIDAWNSATAEYEAFHGKSQDWKSESNNPVKKSPLWYNIPYDSSKGKKAMGPSSAKVDDANSVSQAAADEEDSAPLDFNTFVPSHDPSLPMPSEPPAAAVPPDPSFFIPAPSTIMVSRDEAFNRALSAMYWGGYWTAVYHCQNQQPSQEVGGAEDQEHEECDEEASTVEDDFEDLVPAQR